MSKRKKTPGPLHMTGRYLNRNTKGVVLYHEKGDADERFHLFQFNDERSEYAWKLDLGAECNRLLDLADAFEQGKFAVMGPGATHNEHADIIRSIVQRVAEFEDLATEPKKAKVKK